MSADLRDAHWIKSPVSAQDDCVEVAFLEDGDVLMRDSKDPDGTVLRFTRSEWDAFVEGVQMGAFELDA